jgi:hypothetical protein
MTTLIPTQSHELQQRPPATPALPAEDFDCGAGDDCFYCACPQTD